MNLAIYQVDAFTDHVFGGNPAAVIPLEKWLDDAILQAIANENNLSETAYIVTVDKDTPYNTDNIHYELRWFTPISEVDMCGHATLAAAHVIFKHLKLSDSQIAFITKSGKLTVEKHSDGYLMDFPAVPSQLVELAGTDTSMKSGKLLEGLKIPSSQIVAISSGTDYLIELASSNDVETSCPDVAHWQALDARGVIITAAAPLDNAAGIDFVSRCFYPEMGVPEDPVTGSAHCQLTPYWSKKLGKTKLTAVQLSKRRGHLQCELVTHSDGDRVRLIGQAVDYIVGEIRI